MKSAGVILNRINIGFIAFLVGFTSSVALIYQAAFNLGADLAMVSSWIFALGIGMGITSIGLSLYYRAPILVAWSTPGAALLITSTNGFSINQTIGAFIVSAVLITLSGMTGWFEKILQRVPQQIASAMLAGILLSFGIDVFNLMGQELYLVFTMLFTYLICKQLMPRFAMLAILIAGISLAWQQGLFIIPKLDWTISSLIFIEPEWNFAAIMNIGIPLFLVTMATQNIPGVAILKAHNYQPPISKLISVTGLMNIVIAPFGGFAINLAAITAAICMSPEADANPHKRYWAAVSAGAFYLFMGATALTLMTLFQAMPQAFILALAGIALFSTIGTSLQHAFVDSEYKEAALMTFLVTASDFSLWNIGSALWGVLAGVITLFIAYLVTKLRRKTATALTND
ncbi:benzoate/H(+) symporter BenE family transporter [Shewanella sp. D64]|uniref:benzoate/H(+) symporter BenE family transporter n=1 Tax=unclassified Shewanella TaxID=196818 RepID=UPI0022BA5533|nr:MULTISPECIES: benzoate/H(+) symporter BenE family transporter [unclassified Shewanella]MEC4725350.1 benzoate/H(+) symporter BenE family transporter [Shewanella sp. D64]MEC4735804.1 benzoate/H(+) symporter BenE family transporter [Shewanella sp. E94]WBJ93225.1 benzoate/H(+) symporter BenE family transporter [Shewanella sp. MTB7]